jgi:hypothetical protein
MTLHRCVADLWTATDRIEEYVHFLTMMWVALTYDGVAARSLQGETAVAVNRTGAGVVIVGGRCRTSAWRR